MTSPPADTSLPVSSQQGGLALSPIAYDCVSGDCPTVYTTNRGTIVIQGFAVQPSDAGVAVPAGELLVEIPPALLAAAAGHMAASQQ